MTKTYAEQAKEQVEALFDGESTRNASYKAGFNACRLKVLTILAAQPTLPSAIDACTACGGTGKEPLPSQPPAPEPGDLVEKWHSESQVSRELAADSLARMRQGETLTYECSNGPTTDFRDLCATELAAWLPVHDAKVQREAEARGVKRAVDMVRDVFNTALCGHREAFDRAMKAALALIPGEPVPSQPPAPEPGKELVERAKAYWNVYEQRLGDEVDIADLAADFAKVQREATQARDREWCSELA